MFSPELCLWTVCHNINTTSLCDRCVIRVGDSNLTAVLTEQNRPAPSVRLMGPFFGPYVRRTYFPSCLNHTHNVCQFTRSFCDSACCKDGKISSSFAWSAQYTSPTPTWPPPRHRKGEITINIDNCSCGRRVGQSCELLTDSSSCKPKTRHVLGPFSRSASILENIVLRMSSVKLLCSLMRQQIMCICCQRAALMFWVVLVRFRKRRGLTWNICFGRHDQGWRCSDFLWNTNGNVSRYLKSILLCDSTCRLNGVWLNLNSCQS